MRLLAVSLLAVAAVGCPESTTRTPDGSPPDASSVLPDAGTDGGATLDAPVLADAPVPVDAPCPARGTTTTFYELGQCFRVANCCSDGDCAAGLTCNGAGHCVVAEPFCGCISDADCPSGAFDCLTNEVACGICVATPPTCDGATSCAAGETCEGGYCTDPAASCTEPAADL
jgi:hypothetical protein